MLRTLFRSFVTQTTQKTASVPHAAKCLNPEQLKQVAGGLPRGGWLEPAAMSSQLPRGGWC